MSKKRLRLFANRYGLAIVVLLSILVFIVPLLFRFSGGAPITPGAESYTYLHQAELLLEGTSYDAFTDGKILQTPYTALLGILHSLGAHWLLPVMLGVLFMVLLRLYLLKVVEDQFIVLIACVATIISPTTTTLATMHSPLLLSFSFALAGMIFERRAIVSGLLFFLAIVTDPTLGVLICMGWIGKALLDGHHRKIFPSMVALAVAAAWIFVFVGSFTQVIIDLFGALRPDLEFFFELGADAGISVFFPIIGIYGLYSRHLKREQLLILGIILVATLSIFFSQLLLVLSVIFAVLIGYAVEDLRSDKWTLDILRQASLSLIFCVTIFLLIVAARERVDDYPTTEFAEAMRLLQTHRHDGAVLSAPEYAPMVEYFSKRKATLPINADPELIAAAFYTRDSTEVYDFMEGSRTAYVFLTDDMVQDMFTRTDEGLLFVLPNAQRFVFVSQQEESSLWYYIPRLGG